MDSKIRSHFQRVDPVLFRLLGRVGEDKISLTSRHPRLYFRSLCSQIISQQLSGKVSDVFWARFLKLFPGARVNPARLLILSDQTLRQTGISNSKVAYLKNLADYFVRRQIDFPNLRNLSGEEVVGELTKIKGVGRWTAEMFLMFTLGREDVFSSGDQGLKNAIRKYYPQAPDPAIWSPYRTYACLVLWASLEL